MRIEDYRTQGPVSARSGWSSRALLDKFIANGCEPIKDGNGNETWFKLTSTGAIYGYKRRPENQSHVLSVIREVGTVKQMAGFLQGMGFKFPYPKPLRLIEYVCSWSNSDKGVYLDYFAGSGTTGHAVINLNREDGGQRRYILVEMGEHFERVLKPRIIKAVYSKDWKEGWPVSREGSSHFLKYLTLESYEDSLNNLRLRKRPAAQQRLLEQVPTLREEYLLSYCLDAETDGSPSLLDLDAFENPFDYKLTAVHGGESQVVAVNLPESFNYLLGLRVRRVRSKEGFRTIEGTDPDGLNVLVIWRSLSDPDHGNEALERFFTAQGFADRSGEEALDRVYVNGDNTLLNLRPEGAAWKVLLTEEEFKRLMFADVGEGGL